MILCSFARCSAKYSDEEEAEYNNPICLSQTLLGNPKRPVEQANSNTCAELKLCQFFYLFWLKKWFAARLKLFIQLASAKFKLILLKTSLRRQTETTLSNYREYIYKINKNSATKLHQLQNDSSATT